MCALFSKSSSYNYVTAFSVPFWGDSDTWNPGIAPHHINLVDL